MAAPWDRRDARARDRVEAAVLARWLPTVLAAAPGHRERLGRVDDRLLTDRSGLRRLAPTRELDVVADGQGGATSVLRPTLAQVEKAADGPALGAIARALGRDGTRGLREAIVHEYRPLQIHRAGPTGALSVASSRTDLDRMHRTGARAAAVLGLTDDDVVVSAVPAGPTLDHLASVHLAAGAGLPALHARGADDGWDAVAAAVATTRPTVLLVPAADVTADPVRVTGAFVAAGTDVTALRTVVAVGPPPPSDARDAVVRAFAAAGAEVRLLAAWGPDAGRVLYAECAPGSGLHTYPDLEVVEVLDPLTGGPSPADGDLTLTSAGWHGTALLRFQTGAWVERLEAEGPCPSCGRTVPRLVGEIAPVAWQLVAATTRGRGAVDLRGVAASLVGTAAPGGWRAELRSTDRGDELLVELADTPSEVADRDLALRIAAATGLTATRVVAGIGAEALGRATDAAGGPLADRRRRG